jgi:tRNA (guanosine-2'-O-)-methyltransferase
MKQADLPDAVVTPARLHKMRGVLAQRLARVTIVLDNVHDPHNLSAVLRSCDAFGIQDVHVIESVERFVVNRAVSQGVEKWLTIHRWPSPAACRAYLRRRRFRLYRTAMIADAMPVHALPLNQNIALVFGNEHRGVALETAQRCDGAVTIPMCGFVESLNVSVAAAVALATVSRAVRERSGNKAGLPARRQRELLRAWLIRHARGRAGRAKAGT